MNQPQPDEMPLDHKHPVILNAHTNLTSMIETDIQVLTHSICRQLNTFEKDAIINKAIKAVCSSMTPEQGRFFLISLGARPS